MWTQRYICFVTLTISSNSFVLWLKVIFEVFMTALSAIKLSLIVNKLTNFGQVTLIILLTLDKLKRLFISLNLVNACISLNVKTWIFNSLSIIIITFTSEKRLGIAFFYQTYFFLFPWSFPIFSKIFSRFFKFSVSIFVLLLMKVM